MYLDTEKENQSGGLQQEEKDELLANGVITRIFLDRLEFVTVWGSSGRRYLQMGFTLLTLWQKYGIQFRLKCNNNCELDCVSLPL